MKFLFLFLALLSAQAQAVGTGGVFIGSNTFVGAASCNWARTSFQSYASFSTNSSCNNGTAFGSHVSDPGTKIPSITIDAGAVNTTDTFEIIATGAFFSNTANAGCSWTFFDGTTRSNLTFQAQSGNAFNGYIGVLRGEIQFAATGSKTLEIQVTGVISGFGSSDCQIVDTVAGFQDLKISVYRHPLLP